MSIIYKTNNFKTPAWGSWELATVKAFEKMNRQFEDLE